MSQATGKSKVLEGRLRGVPSTIESALSKEIEESQSKSTKKKIDDHKNEQIWTEWTCIIFTKIFKFYFLIKMIPLDRESFKTYLKPSNIILMIYITCQRLKKNSQFWLVITKVLIFRFTIQGNIFFYPTDPPWVAIRER